MTIHTYTDYWRRIGLLNDSRTELQRFSERSICGQNRSHRCSEVRRRSWLCGGTAQKQPGIHDVIIVPRFTCHHTRKSARDTHVYLQDSTIARDTTTTIHTHVYLQDSISTTLHKYTHVYCSNVYGRRSVTKYMPDTRNAHRSYRIVQQHTSSSSPVSLYSGISTSAGGGPGCPAGGG